ncbi:MAG: extracellular solute-binding protein [Spirochaetaceae bacterium]|nr:MAG: extracellular solute-binding protein [Spirochaetaceae bacterium]
MKKSKILLVSLCLFFLATMMLSATGGQEMETVTLRWMWLPEAAGDVENGAFMNTLREKFPEVKFQIEPMLYSAYKEKFPVMMAAGDLPDVFMINAQSYLPQLVEGDLIAPLDDVLAKVGKDIAGNAREGHLAFGNYGGKQYCIPASYSLKYFAQNIRMDWLENLGLDVPVTLEEFREVARSFTFGDPDGNGKDDTYGTAHRQNINFIDGFFHAYGVAPNHHQIGMWRIRNGKHTNDWVQPQMKEALMNLADMYAEGVIHPESLTFDWNQWWNAYLQNKIGMWYHQPQRLTAMNGALVQAGIANAKMWPIAPPKGPYGQGSSNEGQPWGKFFSKANKNLEKAVEVFNYTYTQEFFLDSGGVGDYAFPPKEINAQGWPVFYSFEEAMNTPDYDDIRKKWEYSRIWTGFAIENPNQCKTWPDQALAKHVYQQFLNTLGPAQIEGNKMADRYAVTSSKAVPVPADAKYFVNLQSTFREIATKIVSGKDANQVWNEWLAFYKANGGPEIEKQVNELIPIK